MKKIQIENSNYSFEITDNGQVKLYRYDEDVTDSLGYNIVNDMAYMIDNLIEEDEKRLNLLREAIKECGYEKQDDENVKKRVSKEKGWNKND